MGAGGRGRVSGINHSDDGGRGVVCFSRVAESICGDGGVDDLASGKGQTAGCAASLSSDSLSSDTIDRRGSTERKLRPRIGDPAWESRFIAWLYFVLAMGSGSETGVLTGASAGSDPSGPMNTISSDVSREATPPRKALYLLPLKWMNTAAAENATTRAPTTLATMIQGKE